MIQARPKPVYLCWTLSMVLFRQLHTGSLFTLGVGRLHIQPPRPPLPAVLLVCPSSKRPWWEIVKWEEENSYWYASGGGQLWLRWLPMDTGSSIVAGNLVENRGTLPA